MPATIAQAARQRWPFLLTSGLAMLPDYILDARTVNFTDLSKPLFARDMLRMIVLVFILVALTRSELRPGEVGGPPGLRLLGGSIGH